MKHLSRTLIALILAILTAMTLPAQVFAAATDEKYISEVQIGVGKSAAEAEKSLEGYEILKDDKGNKVDLNKNAGATGVGGKGNRVVYLGFKKTANEKEAITDLAVMNMKGGYSVEDYEALMESQMKEQIIPFVNAFIAAINEYRENYKSANASNRARAQYSHDILNKYIDDDTGGKLGDLLLNETKFEMGDEAYNALPAAEKKNHADIITIVAQANGNATSMIENMLARAADTNENTWIDRFVALTYDDLIDATELPLSKAKKQLAKEYDDTAQTILAIWGDLNSELLRYDEYMADFKSLDTKAIKEAIDRFEKAGDNPDKETAEKYADALAKLSDIIQKGKVVALCDKLAAIKYGNGTLLDFFRQDASAFEEDITLLYPLAAAFSDGQRASLEILSLMELVSLALTEGEGYKDAELDSLVETSIYDGVDRGIYEKGGVALTSDALRTDALNKAMKGSTTWLTGPTIAAMVITGVSIAALCASVKFLGNAKEAVPVAAEEYNRAFWALKREMNAPLAETQFNGFFGDYEVVIAMEHKQPQFGNNLLKATNRVTLGKGLIIGFSIVMVLMMATTAYLTYRDMANRYNVDFTPIPRYMVDEKDITGYNVKGEKIVLKNQAAYYKAALCNRTGGDYYGTVGNMGDLNGYVGKQWLALYAAKNEAEAPILADSLKYVNNAEIPAGYEKGIHSFGTDAAENLNNTLYVWNSSAPKAYVYFKIAEGSPASTAGSSFTAGTVAIAGAAGLAVGALAAALCVKASKKRKENKAVPA